MDSSEDKPHCSRPPGRTVQHQAKAAQTVLAGGRQLSDSWQAGSQGPACPLPSPRPSVPEAGAHPGEPGPPRGSRQGPSPLCSSCWSLFVPSHPTGYHLMGLRWIFLFDFVLAKCVLRLVSIL